MSSIFSAFYMLDGDSGETVKNTEKRRQIQQEQIREKCGPCHTQSTCHVYTISVPRNHRTCQSSGILEASRENLRCNSSLLEDRRHQTTGQNVRVPSLWMRSVITLRMFPRTPSFSSIPPIPTAKLMIATYCIILLIPPRFRIALRTASSIPVV